MSQSPDSALPLLLHDLKLERCHVESHWLAVNMGVGMTMSPQEYLSWIDELVRLGDDDTIIVFVQQHGDEFYPRFTVRERDSFYGVLHTSMMAVELRDWAAEQPR